MKMIIQAMDIWRYPIYNMKTKDGKNAFYEVAMPGPEIDMENVWGYTFSDYYQPIHENGNLLSYPVYQSGFPKNYDLGSFLNGGTEVKQPLTGDTALEYGTGSGYQKVAWAEKWWEQGKVTHTHTLNNKESFKFAAKGGASLFGGDISVKLKISFHTDKSWSNTNYTENTTAKNNGITINFPTNTPTRYSYSFLPILYTTTDGTLKLAHTVDIHDELKTQGNFLLTHYKGQPDLSLNLPRKFWWKSNEKDPDWEGHWYVGLNRMLRSRMRGLFLLSNEPKEANKGKEEYLAYAPTEGDVIYVQTYVYNYSVDTEAGPFKVRFSYAPYVSDLDDQAPALTTIGDFEVGTDPRTNPPLKPLERREVYVKWDTTGLGGEEPATGKDYVIYVTLDPDNEVPNEFHELYAEDQSPAPGPCPIDKNKKSGECDIFCGSNNQGYWPWDNSFAIFSPKSGSEGEPEIPLELAVKPFSLEVFPTHESEQYGDQIFTHVEYRIRAVITANRSDQAFREVFFYDNDRMFAMRRLFGVKAGENVFHCRWTPEKAGDHTLIMVVENEEKETSKEDNGDFLQVEVLPFERPLHR